MKTIYGRQFALMASVVLLSFALLGGSFMSLSYQYILSEKRQSLERNAATVADMTAYALRELKDATLTTPYIQNNLVSLAGIADAGILITTTDGVVALAVGSDGTLQGFFQGRQVDPAAVAAADSQTGFTGMTDLGGLYGERRYVVGIPITVDNIFHSYTAGIVFMSSATDSLAAVWRETAAIFLMSALVVILLACLMVSITSRQQTRPLHQIADAARQFGLGDLDVRVDVGSREDEIGELAEAFNAMADSLAKSEEKRSEFIANVSHELKTPMTTIAGFADGILDGTIPQSREREYLQVISSETRRLSRLVRSMLDISRLRSAGGESAQSEFDVGEVLVRVLVSLEGKINAKELSVDTDLPQEPALVWGDPDAITQVCYNLLDNAIKFSRPGGHLSLEIKFKGPKAYISISNEGETIPPEEISMIFDRFHKSDRSRSLDRDGVGLGLYIVKMILNNHKETITCASEDGVTRFTFTLTKA